MSDTLSSNWSQYLPNSPPVMQSFDTQSVNMLRRTKDEEKDDDDLQENINYQENGLDVIINDLNEMGNDK